MAIKFWDYLREYESEKADLVDAIQHVLQSGQLILGESVAAFEREFAAYCGRVFGVGVDNGTNAISLGLLALGVQPGDEVITVANTAIPTISAIVTMGAVPRFVDIDPATYLMDVKQLPDAITRRTRCILPVHLYGQCVAMDELRDVAQRAGLDVLEDCAQAHGATYRGTKAGGMSRAAAFSFYPTKVLGAYGDGGMVLCDDEATNRRLRSKRCYGMADGYYAAEHGYNCRLDELQAEILRRKLRRLEQYIVRRRYLAGRYDEQLADINLQLPVTRPENTHVYSLYVVRHPRRDEIIRQLRQRDIHVGIHYPSPIHTMRAYEELGYREGSLPAAEAAAREVFSLPLYPSLADVEQDAVCCALRDIVAQL
jgi:aminotransferase EvaB